MQLNDEQKAIVEFEPKLNHCLRVLACAGSGKSTTATYKVKYMVEHYKIQPNKILMITFSNRAARDLRKKLKANTGLTGKKAPTVSTIHGMCLDILRKHSSEDLTVISTWENLVIYRNILEKHLGLSNTKKKYTTTAASKIADLLSELYAKYDIDKHKKELDTIMYDNSRNFENEYDNEDAIVFTYGDFYEIVNKADRYKIENNLLSFDDIVYKAFELLMSDDKVLEHTRKQSPYLFVDEVQDCSPIQNLFYYNVFNTGHTVLIGDKTQEIYQFRWSDSRYIEEENLLKAFKQVDTKLLTYNFRSAHSIVTLGNMFRGYAKSEVIQKPSEYTKHLVKDTKIQRCRDQVAEGKLIARQIKKLLDSGAEPKDIAVLTRTNKYITTIIEPSVLDIGVPYIIQGSKTRKLTDKSEILYLVNCFQLMVASPKAQIYLVKQILENIQGIGPSTANKVMQSIQGNIWSLIESSLSKIDSLKKLLLFVQECSFKGLDIIYIGHYIDKFLECSKFDLNERYVAEIKQLFSNWASIYIEDTGKTLEQIIPEIQTSLDSVEEENSNAVKLSSIHSTKGLEFKHVICGGFTYRTSKLASMNEEELNIMYVQFSRAIESLYIVHSDRLTYMGEDIVGHKQKWLRKLLSDLGD